MGKKTRGVDFRIPEIEYNISMKDWKDIHGGFKTKQQIKKIRRI